MTTDFVYTPATTDITFRWRAIYGWVPPSEQVSFQKKWANFRALGAQGVESLDVRKPVTTNLVQWKSK